MRIVFMGTPDFAVATLEALCEAGFDVIAAVSQPDKPKGRHGILSPTPVKEKAMELGIPVFQPEKAKDSEFIEKLRELAPDLIVVTAYGQILKKELLSIPKYGCINVHASLLPRWRGAAPVQWSIIEGDKVTGVTTMLMDEGLDTGDMLLKKEVEIGPKETGGSLFEKLAKAGGELIVETVKRLEAGELKREKQNEELMTYASMLDKHMGKINWNREAAEIERLIRGLDPWPGTYSFYEKKMLKLWDADVIEDTEELSKESSIDTERAEAGSVVLASKKGLVIKTGKGFLKINDLQPEGKKRMKAEEFLRGSRISEGTVLG